MSKKSNRKRVTAIQAPEGIATPWAVENGYMVNRVVIKDGKSVITPMVTEKVKDDIIRRWNDEDDKRFRETDEEYLQYKRYIDNSGIEINEDVLDRFKDLISDTGKTVKELLSFVNEEFSYMGEEEKKIYTFRCLMYESELIHAMKRENARIERCKEIYGDKA